MIGVRCENLEHQKEPTDQKDPSLAEVMGVLFNVMFLDHLATDIEHLERVNQLLSNGQRCAEAHGIIPCPVAGDGGSEKMRPLRHLLITPSVDLAQLAVEHR